MYEIIYDYDDGWTEYRNNVEIFEGSWDELQECIRRMKKNGCYNIDAVCVREEVSA